MKQLSNPKEAINTSMTHFSLPKWRVLLSMLFLWISIGMYASTIHWITFINTNDPSVGKLDDNARKVLYSRFVNMVNSEVAQYGYDVNIYDYYGGNFTSKQCLDCIKDLQCDSTDVVVFYFIGHGCRITNDPNIRYPLMLFDDHIDNGIPISWVHNSLKNKNARLILTFAVSSNTYVDAGDKLQTEYVVLPAIRAIKTAPSGLTQCGSVIAEAFLGYKGDIIACSASPGQNSWCIQTPLGGMDVFTYFFTFSFEKLKEEPSFSWSKFLDNIAETVTESTKDMPMQGVQTPIYDYNLIPSAILDKR